MLSNAPVDLSLLAKLLQHVHRIGAPTFGRLQARPQSLKRLRQRDLVEGLEALNVEAVNLPSARFDARPGSRATDAHRRAENVLRQTARDSLRGYTAVKFVAGLDVNIDRFIAPADLHHFAIQSTRLDDRADSRLNRPVAACKVDDFGLAAEDPAHRIVGRQLLVNLTESIRRRLRPGSEANLVKAPLHLVLRDGFNSGADGQTAWLKLVEVDVLLVAKQQAKLAIYSANRDMGIDAGVKASI